MKLKKLRKRIEQLEKRLREGPDKLARLQRKLQQAESAKALKAARKSAARAIANRKNASPAQRSDGKEPSATKQPKKKLNLSPERRAQLSATMKARWAAKRAGAGNSTMSSDKNSGTPPTQAPPNNADGI